ncbi:STAS domain-containing protein [Pseudomonas sp. B2M1-30]|uniref:STAS domain-containing protein n=1 Tax=Pseudomonas TaxID=286 RepID=UPI001C3CD565|nr:MULTISPECIES: STAS domain-containing protein [Pseudomonas]MBV4473600.1 STAS domain-containing protein [Pseudomonas botevensis]MCU0117740.1 STAS domain-containing protein [Pseudomonas sp. B2M1-30]MCU7259276.1 STAS domain-containing protein [Pseudomonas koreensis]
MAIVNQCPEGGVNWVIDGELTIYTVAELKAELLPSLAPNGDVEVDLALVNEIDSAGVQLLLALRQAVTACGNALHMKGASPAVRDALQLCNLAHVFDGHASLI